MVECNAVGVQNIKENIWILMGVIDFPFLQCMIRGGDADKDIV